MYHQTLKKIRDAIAKFKEPLPAASSSDEYELPAEEEIKLRAKEGREVLARYDRDRSPFVLFLRTFQINVVFGNPAHPGDPSGVYYLRDFFDKALRYGVRTLAIAEPSGETPLFPSSRASLSPLLLLDHDEWESVVADLVPAASIIVMELEQLTPGVTREIEMIESHFKTDRTIVVLPPGPELFSLSELTEPLAGLPRVICADELPTQNLLESFVFSDLIEETYEVAKLTSHERLSLDLNDERKKRFPPTFRGVGRGYERLGQMHLRQGDLSRATARFQKALIAFGVEGDLEGWANQSLNLARVASASGDNDVANARKFLEGVKNSLAARGYEFDVEASLSELARGGFLELN